MYIPPINPSYWTITKAETPFLSTTWQVGGYKIWNVNDELRYETPTDRLPAGDRPRFQLL